jgi:hypothetical protein
MIERRTIKGRRATVAYLTSEFTPADKDDYQLVKILFDDGDMMIAEKKEPEQEPEEDEE